MDDAVPSELKKGEIPQQRAAFWEEWPSWVILAGIWAFSLWAWPRLPAQVPIHWGFRGQVDGWATPLQAAVIMPGFLTGIYALMLLYFNARFDFKAARLMDPAVARRVRFLVVFMFAALQGLMLAAPLKGGTLKATGINALLGVFFVLLGNLMPRLEPNAWVGIRIPPTLEDRTVWKRTHRLGGKVFVTGGLLSLLACLLPASIAEPVFLGILLAMALIPIVYAYRIRPD